MMASEAITIRVSTLRDTGFVRSTSSEALAEYDGPTASTRVLRMVSNPRARTLIAERSGEPVGFVVVLLDDEDAHLAAIAVARDHRGRGVGRRLLQAAERLAVARGALTMRLETGEANLAAIDLFVRAGYLHAGRIARYYRTGYDALVLRKGLGANAKR